MGISRTLKTQEITFMHKKQPFWKKQQKIYVMIYNKNKSLIMPFATKHNKRIKVQGSLENTTTLNKTRHFIVSPPHLGEALSSMIQNENKRLQEEEKRKRKEKEEKSRVNEEEISQFSLRSVWRTLEVKVLHHVPKHLIVFFGHVVAP